MAKVTIPNISSGFASTTAYNSAFDIIEGELNNKVLYRNNPVGEPNQMETDLDMNGNSILNVSTWNADNLSVENLTVNGQLVTPSDLAFSVLPDVSGQSGKLLSTDGVSAYWESFDAQSVAVKTSERTLLNKLSDTYSLKDFGAVGDGVSDDTDAFNLAIAEINAGTLKTLLLTEGTYKISSALTTIIGDDWCIYGDGLGSTEIVVSSTAGTLGTVFTVGDASNTSSRFEIKNLSISFDNSATLNGTGNAINLSNASQGFIDCVKVNTCNGFLTFGNSVDNTIGQHIVVTRCRSNALSNLGGKHIYLQSFASLYFSDCYFSASNTASSSFRGLYVVPTVTDLADTLKVVNCEWNYTPNSPTYIVEYDSTNNSIGSQQFTNCVIDQSYSGANIYLHNDVGAIDNARISINFVNCVGNGRGSGNVLLVDNSGNKHINCTWVGGSMSAYTSDKCLTVTGGYPVNVVLHSTRLYSRTVGAMNEAITIGDGCSGVQIINNTTPLLWLQPNLAFATPFTFLVNFSGSATNCIISENNASQCSNGLVKFSAISPTNLHTLKIVNNVSVKDISLPFSYTTTNATPTTVATIPLTDETSYTVKVKVHSQRSNGSDQGYYEVTGLFYRDGGGVATLRGSLSAPVTIETTTGHDATLSVSGNNVDLVVTGGAYSVVWRYSVEVSSNPG